MIKGSCLCGRVRYSYSGEIQEISLCHCSQCRKAQGSAYGCNSPVDNSKLKFEGSEFIKSYLSSGDKVRAFCSECGSPLYSAKASAPGVKRLRIGTVETSFTCEKVIHIHTASTPAWHEITDSYQQFENAKQDQD